MSETLDKTAVSQEGFQADPYGDAINYLYGFINLEHKRVDRYMASKMDATRPGRLLTYFGSPHEGLPAIHIAGTKGKGSVAAMCAACLRAAGLKVGLYTSPHVQEFRERIRVLTPEDADGLITEADFVAWVDKLKTAVPHFPGITWFEIVTAIAFLHFARQQVDVAVIEVGLGGRLDATNVITPLVSVITSLSLDHTYLLGDTIDKIAFEKGGIIKPGVPVVTAAQKPEALAKLMEIAAEREAPLAVIGRNWHYVGEGRTANGQARLTITQTPDPDFIPPQTTFTLSLVGEHQLENGAVALAALQAVRHRFKGLGLTAVQTGLASTHWTGRLQILHQADHTPTLLVDCAHNVDSVTKLSHALTHDFTYERLILVFGATADKDVTGMIPHLFPLAATTIVTVSSHPRAASPSELVLAANDLHLPVQTAPTVAAALTDAWQLAGANDLICVTGSIFIVGDLLNEWPKLEAQLLSNYVIT
ncbi:MAG: bifunctional folylpolyglutamate synthase/dihydrofolate synthase [Ardenticatenaceae bacterium]|nr:bifunctional folylpolyglutamate synthase/dihydrofolate synthase [Ardenticatenaceae bacterium]